MSVHWAELGKVAWVSLAFGAGIAVVFALGVLGAGATSRSGVTVGERSGAARVRGYAVAATCFTACAAAALFGIYLIVPQFHR